MEQFRREIRILTRKFLDTDGQFGVNAQKETQPIRGSGVQTQNELARALEELARSKSMPNYEPSSKAELIRRWAQQKKAIERYQPRYTEAVTPAKE